MNRFIWRNLKVIRPLGVDLELICQFVQGSETSTEMSKVRPRAGTDLPVTTQLGGVRA